MSPPASAAPIRECPACHIALPAKPFCGNCGAEVGARSGTLRRLLRPAAFAVAPHERVEWPLVTSSMFPHLSEPARKPFQHGLFLLTAMLAVFSALRLLGPLVTVISVGVPLLFLLYLWRSDAIKNISAPALAISALLGAVSSTAWWLWTADVVASAYGVPLGAAAQLEHALGIGLVIAMVGAVLMVMPAVVLRAMRPPGRESLDGFLIGALGALFYSAAGNLTWLASQFTVGLLDNFSSWRLAEDALLYGLVDPLIAAAAGGMVGLALWFRPAHRGGPGPWRLRAVLWVFAAVCIGIYMTVYAVDIAELPRASEMSINVVLTALAILVMRSGVQIALLHELPDPATGHQVRCGHCGRTEPDMPFCPDCGAATRALSRSSRRLRWQSAAAPANDGAA